MADKSLYVKYGQGPAQPVVDSSGTVVDPFEKQLDDLGFTNPNLHRRLDIRDPELPQVAPNTYEFGIYGLNSYRTKKINYHDEDSEISEIP